MSSNEELEVLHIVTNKLTMEGIDYMVTGSVAMSFYATPRMTRDIDIVVEVGNDDVTRIVKLFGKEFYVEPEMVLQAISDEGMFNIIHNKSVVKVDCIIRKSSDYRQVEFGRRRMVQIGSDGIWLVSPEDLVLSKLWWAQESYSEQQLADIRNITHHVKELDHDYIRNWVEKLGLTGIHKRIENE